MWPLYLYKNKLHFRTKIARFDVYHDNHSLPCLFSAFISRKLVYFGTRFSISSPATYTTFSWSLQIKFNFTWLIVPCTYSSRQHNESSQNSLSLLLCKHLKNSTIFTISIQICKITRLWKLNEHIQKSSWVFVYQRLFLLVRKILKCIC